jgi:cation/acetate symporter
MSVHAHLRTPNPHLGAYYGIVTSAFVSLVIMLALLEQLGWNDALIAEAMIAVPLLLYLIIAFCAHTLDVDEFFTSGRRVPPVFNGFALAATAVGGIGFFAYTGTVFFLGFDALAIGLGWTVGLLLAAVLFVPYLRKAGSYTLPSFLGHRFRSRYLRMTASVLQLPPTALLLAAEMKIAAMVAALFLPLSFSFAVILVGVVVAASVLLGGMRSLTWTGSAEFLTGAVGLAAPLIIVSILLTNLPAPQFTYGEALSSLHDAEITTGLTPTKPDIAESPLPSAALLPVTKPFLEPFGELSETDFVFLFLSLALGTAALPSLLVRSGVTRSVADQRRAVGWALLLVALFAITAPAIAAFAKLLIFQGIAQAPASAPPDWLSDLARRHLLQSGDSNGDGAIVASELRIARDSIAIALPLAMKLPYVFTALIAASGMAIALAAAGSHLFTLSASLAEDLYRVIDRRPTALPRLIAAWASIGASALAACMFLLIADLDPLHVGLTAFAFAGSTFFAPLLLAIWWPRCTLLGAFAALGVGFLVIVAGTVGSALGVGPIGVTTAMASLIGSALGLIAGIAASFMRPGPSHVEKAFFEEMRDPEGEAIYDRAQQRAAAAAAAAAAQAAASQ